MNQTMNTKQIYRHRKPPRQTLCGELVDALERIPVGRAGDEKKNIRGICLRVLGF